MRALELAAAAILREAIGHSDDALLKAALGVASSLMAFGKGEQSATATMEQLDATKDAMRLHDALEEQRAKTLADLSRKFDTSDK